MRDGSSRASFISCLFRAVLFQPSEYQHDNVTLDGRISQAWKYRFTVWLEFDLFSFVLV